MKLDLIMWTYNSSKHLAKVLERIDQVVPAKYVHSRFIVDDHSTDDTREIARNCGWNVYMNRGKGIADNKNTAISLVQTPIFASFEHDVLLARDWWIKLSKLMENPTVAVAQGIRLATTPKLRQVDDYVYHRRTFHYDEACPRSLDNNLARTDLIRKFGYAEGVTPILLKQVGYTWVIDDTVVSEHLREGIVPNLVHKYNVSCLCPQPLPRMTRMLLSSPARAVHMAIKEKCLTLLFLYPTMRVIPVLAALKRRRFY
jgi:glycosyltransferase involved in cell wall biosynthesis